MKKILIWAGAALALGLSSCGGSKNDNPGPAAGGVTITATLPSSTSVTWANGAAFTLYSDVVADQFDGGRTFTCSNAAANTFTGNIADNGSRTTIYAIYPRQTAPFKSNYSVSVPDSQDAGNGSQYEILTASAPVSGNFTSASLAFRQLCAVWTVSFTNLTDAPKNITSITLTSTENIFSVAGTIASLDLPDFTATTTRKVLTATFASPVAANGTASLVMLPSDLVGKTVTVAAVCDDGTQYALHVIVPATFGASGTAMATSLDMNIITPGGTTPPEETGDWSKVATVADIVSGTDYLIVGSQPNTSSSKYDLLTNSVRTFTYPTDGYGDANNLNADGTPKAGALIDGGYGATLGNWSPANDAVWTFTLEGNFGMSTSTGTVNVPGYSILNKMSNNYLSMGTNGQYLALADYIDNSISGGPLLKQRWALEDADASGLVNIRCINNSGRYVMYFPPDGTFVLTSQPATVTTFRVFIYKRR